MVCSNSVSVGHRILNWSRDLFNVKPVALVINACALIISFGILMLVWEFIQPNPIKSVSIISVDPASRIIDRSHNAELVVQRRVCASRSASVRLIRLWVDTASGITPTLDDFSWLDKGCNDRPPVHVVVPPSLNPGIHRYRVTLESCSNLRLSCHQYHLEDVEVLIVGHYPVTNRMPNAQRF